MLLDAILLGSFSSPLKSFPTRIGNGAKMSVNVNNLTWHEGAVTSDERQKLLGHAGCTIWVTGVERCDSVQMLSLLLLAEVDAL